MDRQNAPARDGVALPSLAVVVLAMAVSAVVRRGGFYPIDAFGLGIVAVLVIVVALVRSPIDRATGAVVVVGGLLALWWAVRSGLEHQPSAVLPLGASVLCLVAAFVVVRSLSTAERTTFLDALVALASLMAGVGLLGVLLGWAFTAQAVDGVWRLTGTMTYAGATAVVLVAVLLLALSGAQRWQRVSVVVIVAALLATRSPAELLGLVVAAGVVPRACWTRAVVPLVLGVVAGCAVLLASNEIRSGAVAVLALCVVVACGLLAGITWPEGTSDSDPRPKAGWSVAPQGSPAGISLGLIVVGCFVALAALHTTGHGGHSRPTSLFQAWSSAAEAWRSSPVTGIGAPRLYDARTPVGGFQGVVANGYLAMVAEGGVVAVLLLLGLGVATVRVLRRVDVRTSCALAALVAFVVNGAVDYAWQLTAVGVLGGCLAGLASAPVGAWAPSLSRRTAVVWVAVAAMVVVVQTGVGEAVASTAASNVVAPPPPPTSTPGAPARTIATGGDLTDPFMLHVGSTYLLYTSIGTSLQNVPVRTAQKLGTWSAPVDALPRLPAWAEAGANWAPDVYQVPGGWMLYFTALVRWSAPSIHCIGDAFAKSPTGPFSPFPRPFVCQVAHRGSIDPRVYVNTDGRPVLLWKSDDNANPRVPGPDQGGDAGIWSQPLSTDGRHLLGQATEILRPTETWEANIVEAPDMIKSLGTYWLFFSGNWYFSPEYGIGVAACQTPEGPCSDPLPAPFIGSNLQGSGPGESSLFVDGHTIALLYNPFRANDPGPLVPRPVVEARIGFNLNGPYLAAFT